MKEIKLTKTQLETIFNELGNLEEEYRNQLVWQGVFNKGGYKRSKTKKYLTDTQKEKILTINRIDKITTRIFKLMGWDKTL